MEFKKDKNGVKATLTEFLNERTESTSIHLEN
jgi:hypothetical protein